MEIPFFLKMSFDITIYNVAAFPCLRLWSLISKILRTYHIILYYYKQTITSGTLFRKTVVINHLSPPRLYRDYFLFTPFICAHVFDELLSLNFN